MQRFRFSSKEGQMIWGTALSSHFRGAREIIGVLQTLNNDVTNDKMLCSQLRV